MNRTRGLISRDILICYNISYGIIKKKKKIVYFDFLAINLIVCYQNRPCTRDKFVTKKLKNIKCTIDISFLVNS